MEKKGISPLIATVLIIGFIIVLAALVFLWGTDLFKKVQEQTSTESETKLSCSGLLLDVKAKYENSATNVKIENKNDKELNGYYIRTYDDKNIPKRTIKKVGKIAPFSITNYADISGAYTIGVFPLINIKGKTTTCSGEFKSVVEGMSQDLPNDWEADHTCCVAQNVMIPEKDCDGDNLLYKDEFYYGTDPCEEDTDGDGLSDGNEVNLYETDPTLLDTDGDDYTDGQEVVAGSDPKSPTSFPVDKNTNLIDDKWEALQSCCPEGKCDPNADYDNDGLTTKEEYNLNLNPCLADTDGDGLSDGDEISLRTQYSCLDPKNPDSDNDRLKDGEEINTYSTNPCLADTDGDGWSDFLEIKWGTDPTKADSKPIDTDKDEIPDLQDNCPFVANPDQKNSDTDTFGDACDTCLYLDNSIIVSGTYSLSVYDSQNYQITYDDYYFPLTMSLTQICEQVQGQIKSKSDSCNMYSNPITIDGNIVKEDNLYKLKFTTSILPTETCGSGCYETCSGSWNHVTKSCYSGQTNSLINFLLTDATIINNGLELQGSASGQFTFIQCTTSGYYYMSKCNLVPCKEYQYSTPLIYNLVSYIAIK